MNDIYLNFKSIDGPINPIRVLELSSNIPFRGFQVNLSNVIRLERPEIFTKIEETKSSDLIFTVDGNINSAIHKFKSAYDIGNIPGQFYPGNIGSHLDIGQDLIIKTGLNGLIYGYTIENPIYLGENYLYIDINNIIIPGKSPCVSNFKVAIQDTRNYKTLKYYNDEKSYACQQESDDTIIPEGIKGDINQDGTVNVVDIVQTISFILGSSEPNDYQFWAADINDDGQINVVDIVNMVNIILGD